MSTAPKAEDHLPPGIIPPVRPTAPWRVAFVEALDGYVLKVRFMDGTEGFVRMAGAVSSPKGTLFKYLREPGRFEEVYLDMGAVTWPNGLDLAPDAMYDEIKAHGEWVLKE